MTGPFAYSAPRQASESLQALASLFGRKSRITLWPSTEVSGRVSPTEESLMQDLKQDTTLPPLVLTCAMQRDALIQDRNKAALMLDMQAVHRIESDLRRLTNHILASRTCSGDAC